MNMTNADVIRSMSDEQLACLLAGEAYRIAQPVFEYVGHGFTEEFLIAIRLKWLRQPVEN